MTAAGLAALLREARRTALAELERGPAARPLGATADALREAVALDPTNLELYQRLTATLPPGDEQDDCLAELARLTLTDLAPRPVARLAGELGRRLPGLLAAGDREEVARLRERLAGHWATRPPALRELPLAARRGLVRRLANQWRPLLETLDQTLAEAPATAFQLAAAVDDPTRVEPRRLPVEAVRVLVELERPAEAALLLGPLLARPPVDNAAAVALARAVAAVEGIPAGLARVAHRELGDALRLRCLATLLRDDWQRDPEPDRLVAEADRDRPDRPWLLAVAVELLAVTAPDRAAELAGELSGEPGWLARAGWLAALPDEAAWSGWLAAVPPPPEPSESGWGRWAWWEVGLKLVAGRPDRVVAARARWSPPPGRVWADRQRSVAALAGAVGVAEARQPEVVEALALMLRADTPPARWRRALARVVAGPPAVADPLWPESSLARALAGASEERLAAAWLLAATAPPTVRAELRRALIRFLGNLVAEVGRARAAGYRQVVLEAFDRAWTKV